MQFTTSINTSSFRTDTWDWEEIADLASKEPLIKEEESTLNTTENPVDSTEGSYLLKTQTKFTKSSFASGPFYKQWSWKGVALRIIDLALFGITSYFIAEEVLGSRDIKVLTLATAVNGLSISFLYNHLLPERGAKAINSFFSKWSYPLFFTASQFYLNFVSRKLEDLWSLPFIEFYGLLEGNNLITLLNSKQANIALGNRPKVNRVEPLTPLKPLKTLAFNPKDTGRSVKVYLGAEVILAIALTTLNFSTDFTKEGDLGLIGLLQDLIAMFAGSVIGEIAIRLLRFLKEKLETRHYSQLNYTEKTPLALKIIRVFENSLILINSTAVGFFLGMSIKQNSVFDYFLKMGVGFFYGVQQDIFRYEFIYQNPEFLSRYVTRSNSIQLNATQLNTAHAKRCAHLKLLVQKHLTSMLAYASLVGYMIYAAATDPTQVDGAITILLTLSVASYVLTNYIAINFRPEENRRLFNELAFRLLTFEAGVSIPFQYLTNKNEINDEVLDQDKLVPYILALTTWGTWGIALGNDRSRNTQSNIPLFSQASTLTTQEASKKITRFLKK